MQKEPIVNIRLFGNRNFVISNIFMLLMGLIVVRQLPVDSPIHAGCWAIPLPMRGWH